MRQSIRLLTISLAVLSLGACGTGRPIKYYTVGIPAAPPASNPSYSVTVLIGRIGSPEFLKDTPIAYRSGANEIGTYEYHQWSEPPVQMVKVALVRRLRASGKFGAVTELGSSVEGEFVISGRLYDFEEVDNGTIAALVSMEFELNDRKSGHTVWSHFYSHSEPVPGKEIPTVVAALDRNLNQGLQEVVASLDEYFSTHTPQKP